MEVQAVPSQGRNENVLRILGRRILTRGCGTVEGMVRGDGSAI
jgi:hypothetical protein